MKQHTRLETVKSNETDKRLQEHLLGDLPSSQQIFLRMWKATIHVIQILHIDQQEHLLQVQVAFLIECQGKIYRRDVRTLIPPEWVQAVENDQESEDADVEKD